MNNRGRWVDNRRGGDFGGSRGRGFGGSRGRGFGGPRGGGFGPPRGFGRPPRGFNGPPRGFRGGFRPQFRGPGTEDNPGKRLSEKEIGITEYISSLDGFSGVIKSRYSDFQVSEVNVQGEVARLTQRTAPEPGKAEDAAEDDEELRLLSKYDTRLVSLDTWDKLSALAALPNSVDKVEVETEDMSKEGRTKIYDSVKATFGGRLVGSTVTTGEKKAIVFMRPQKGIRLDTREKWLWPEEYVHFLVYKENMDTMEAAGTIAEALRMGHVKPAFFGYCGTKDRRAKTTQWFSLRKVDPRRIVSSCRRLRNVSVGNFRFSPTHLRLGYLRGNRFRIALRNVTAPDEDIAAAVVSLEQKGFLNYYGLQRFGSRADIPTHRVGRCLLQGRFDEAVALLLDPAASPDAAALHLYRATGDAQAALRLLPPRATSTEARLLSGLAHSAKADLVTALERIPRNTRLLYIHSYQSWVWNRCVSERIRRWGLTPHVGDLVPLNPEELANTEEVLEETLEDADDFETEEVQQQSRDGSRKRGVKYPDTNKKDIKVKVLTEEDIEEYSILDIVLPLPGYSIEYPPNMKEYYEDIIVKEDSLTLELKQKVKAYCLSGAYRKIVLKPENLTWKIVKYSDPYCDLILSDLDELQGKEASGEVEDGKYRALLVEMTLPASTYATMALRELLKRDTSSESQAKFNDYHKEIKTVTPSEDSVVKESSLLDSVVKESSLLESVDNESSLLEELVVKEGEEATNGDAALKMETTDGSLEVEPSIVVETVAEKRKSDDTASDDSKKARLA